MRLHSTRFARQLANGQPWRTLPSCIFPNQLFVGSGREKVATPAIARPGKAPVGRANLIAVFIQQLTWYVTAALWNKVNRLALVSVLVNSGGWTPNTLRLYLPDLVLYATRQVVALAAHQHQASEKNVIDKSVHDVV